MSAALLRRTIPAFCVFLLAIMLCACGGQSSVSAPNLDLAFQPVTADSGLGEADRSTGLPSLKEIAAILPHVPTHRNRRGAEYEPLASSPGACFTVGADLSLSMEAGSEQITYAMYAIGGLSGADTPEALTVVAGDDDKVWIAVSDYTHNTWEWHRPAAVNGIQIVPLTGGGDYFSPAGVMYYALAAYDGSTCTVQECLLSTSAEAGSAVPSADYSTYNATYAELRVRTDGPAAGVSISDGGEISPYTLAETLVGAAVEYEITLPDDGSLLSAQLVATAQGFPSSLLKVIDSDPLDVAVITQSADPLGSKCSDIDASGTYILFWYDGLGAASKHGSAGVPELEDYSFPRDSWPIDNSPVEPYTGMFAGNCWGMSLGASWFNASGRFDAGLGSPGLYEHFADDPLWAQGVAGHLQALQPLYWLSRSYYSGLSGRQRVDELNLAREIALAFGRGLPLYNFSGYPVIGEAGGTPVVLPLAVGHSVMYVGEVGGEALFYDPNNGYDSASNPYLKAVNPYQLEYEKFATPFDSLTGNWSIQSVYDTNEWVRDAFDPANKSDFVNYEYPEVQISKSGDAPVAQIRVASIDDMITIAAASSFWDDFPEYATLNMQWRNNADGEMFYTSDRYSGFNSASEFDVQFSDLLGLAESSSAAIKHGTTVVPYYLQFQTAADAHGDRHYATGYPQPPGVSIYYAGPDWNVLLPPQDVLASEGNPDHVAITWSAPAAGSTPAGYNIYRTTGLEEEWTGPLNSVLWESTTYYDIPPQTGTDYWYAVSSCTAALPGQMESSVSYADSGQQQPPAGSPEISGVSPLSGITGTNITFEATVTGAEPFTYAWNFGGGATPNTSSAASPTVTLGAVGTYDCTLNVSNGAKGSDDFDFQIQSVSTPQELVTIPNEMGYDVDFIRICFEDPLVRRDDSLVIDPFGSVTPRDATAYNDVLKTNGDEFQVSVADFEVYPVIVVIEGDDPGEISGMDDEGALDGIYMVESRPGMLVADISVLTPSGFGGNLAYAYRVYSATGEPIGQDVFHVEDGLPTVTEPPEGVDWGINVWDREELDIGDQVYSEFTFDLDTLATATPDVLWLEFSDGWVYDYMDLGPYSNVVLVIDNATYGTLHKDIRLLTRTNGGSESYLGIVTFSDDDQYDPGAPGDPGNLKAGETYSLSLDDPGTAGIDYDYATNLGVTGV